MGFDIKFALPFFGERRRVCYYLQNCILHCTLQCDDEKWKTFKVDGHRFAHFSHLILPLNIALELFQAIRLNWALQQSKDWEFKLVE